MYCPNCGLKLPDWAHFCERCGSRVGATPDDPLDQVEIDGTFAEPLWDDADETPDAPADDEQAPDISVSTQRMSMSPDETALEDMVEAMDDFDQAVGGALDEELPEAGELGDGELVGEDGIVATQEDEPEEYASDASGETRLMEEPPFDDGEDEELAQDAPDASGETRLMEEPLPDDEQDEEPLSDQAADDDAEQGEHPEVTDEEAPDQGDALLEQLLTVGVIDAGEVESWDDEDVPHYVSDPWRGNARPSERMRRSSWRTTLTALLAVVSALAMGLLVAYLLFGKGAGFGESQEQEKPAKVKYISADKAQEVLTTLNGWWKTRRTYDGRRWHFTGGIMETYAADGKLARQVLVDPHSIEHMSTGPGDIEGSGFFMRDIAYYLLEDDMDTLHAVTGDGDADEDANLLRTDPPDWVDEGTGEDAVTELPEADASEYVLPESATRVYDISELESLSDHDLFVARNEIYARHGYVFEGGELSEYFSSKSWYQPSDVFNEGEITEVERQNVSNILQLEQSRGSRYV